jgi:glycosyltransferase involved in cell wall biosynthesis
MRPVLDIEFKNKSLALITYSSITRNGTDILINRAFGLLTDALAQTFGRIYYIGCEANESSTFYRYGKSIYQYCIQSENVEFFPIHPTEYIANPITRTMQMITNQAVINRAIDESDFTYIFLPGYTGLLSAFVCLCKRKPYFLYFGSSWQETARYRVPEGEKRGIAFFVAREFYMQAEKVIVKKAMFCLSAGKRLAASKVGLNPRSFETIPMVQFQSKDNLMESGHLVLNEEKESPHYKNKCDNVLHILSVGNVDERKGTIYLLMALPHLLSKGFDVKVTLVGAIDETYRSHLVEEMTRYETNDRVHFAGYVNDVEHLQKFYNEADVFVLPTLGEGFPRVLYEAMMSGLPVVASDIDSIRENTHGSEAVSLVTPKDPKAIAEAVQQLVQDQSLRKRRIDAGYRFATQKFHTSPANQVVHYITKFISFNRM